MGKPRQVQVFDYILQFQAFDLIGETIIIHKQHGALPSTSTRGVDGYHTRLHP